LTATKLAEVTDNILKTAHRQRRQIVGLELVRQFEPSSSLEAMQQPPLYVALVEADGECLIGAWRYLDGCSAMDQRVWLEAVRKIRATVPSAS